MNKTIEHFTEENNRESIRDKVIIITASSSKFGYTLAETLAKYDFKVFITGRTQSKVSKAVEKLEKINKNVHGKAADFAVETEVRDMFNEAINHYKKIDILVTLPIQIESNRSCSKWWERVYAVKKIESND